MKLQTILIFLLTSVSLTGQGIMLAGGAVAEEPGGIVTTDLLVYLDANNASSYSGSGSTWSDLSGNNNHFTLVNSPTFNATSKYFSFNGSTQRADASTAIYTASDYDYTWAGWVRFTTSDQTLFSLTNYKNTSGQRAGWLFGVRNRRISVEGREQNSDTYTVLTDAASTPVNQTDFYYYTWTKDNNAWKLYVNGTLITSADLLSGTIGITNTIILFALTGSSGSVYYPGDIAELHLYNRALTAEEVLQNYNATNRY